MVVVVILILVVVVVILILIVVVILILVVVVILILVVVGCCYSHINCCCYSHISCCCYCHISCDGLKVLPKITQQHIQLTPHTVMTVKYNTQLLSKTVAGALSTFGEEDTKETLTFCTLIDSWIDCFNIGNLEEEDRKKKPFLQPYRDSTDTRFDWLEKGFF